MTANTHRAVARATDLAPYAAVATAAILLATLEAAQVYIGMRAAGLAASWPHAVRATLPSWLILAVMIWPTVMLVRRFPLQRGRLARSIPVHVIAAALFTSLHLTGTAAAANALSEPAGIGVWLRQLAAMYFTLDVLTYTAIVGIIQLVHVHQQEMRRERAVAELDSGLSRLRFLALRNQVDPHFIFNALNAINTLAMRGARDELLRTTGSLSSLLRESLRDDMPQVVPLRVELDYIGNYFTLQEVRFPGRFSASLHCTDAAAEAGVPALMLHSLLEQHVVTELAGSGRCEVAVAASVDDVALEVIVVLAGADSGTGVLEASAARLNAAYGGATGVRIVTSPTDSPPSRRITVKIPFGSGRDTAHR